jgi:hypothetical protein
MDTNVIETANETLPKRRHRTGKKRLHFTAPREMPPGVRQLWQSASMEEQQRAHQTCVQILAMWLGKKTRDEAAALLSIPPLRVWQLSQQALSGMLAGLLKQPRSRRGKETSMQPLSEDDPRLLRKRIAQLEKDVRDRDDLIRLLASLPKPTSGPPESSATSKGEKTKRRTASRAEGQGGNLAGNAPTETR